MSDFWKIFSGGIAIGIAIGYIVAVLTLDQFYKHLMEKVIDEIKNQYCRCLDKIRKEHHGS